MNNKSILMPHACQKIGWWILLLAVVLEMTKLVLSYATQDINVDKYLAKASYILLVISLFLITLSKEKVEDEMISGLRLRAIGITSYSCFIVFLFVSLVLELQLPSLFTGLYMSELLLIVLPILIAGLYYLLFRGLLWQSKKEQAL